MASHLSEEILGIRSGLWAIIIAAVSVLVYITTPPHDYTQDDAIVIYDTMYTTQGIQGIPGILTKDTFFGFFKEEGKENLVSGGRYRPLSLVTFALEYQFFGKNTFVGHLINILLYALLCFWVFRTVLFFDDKKHLLTLSLAVVAGLLFATHPIHTEAVANIKGRDEILCMLFCMLSLFYAIKWQKTEKTKPLILSSAFLFLGLLSKEHAISFLAIIPMTFYFFRKESVSSSLAKSMYLILPVAGFMLLRTWILGWNFGSSPMELMNNPFIKIVDGQYLPFSGGEKSATIVFTIAKYFQLLFFPLELTHDYYPRHIEIMNWSKTPVLLAAVMLITSIGVCFLGIRKKQVPSYAILFFFCTFFLMSNVIFPIGTNMSERFMFMPSFGFALLVSYLLHWALMRGNNVKWVVFVALGISALYAFKTIDRNKDWKDDFTLFTTDVVKSKNSAKLNNAAGGALLDRAQKLEDQNSKELHLDKARTYLERAIEIHPNYKNAHLLLGNYFFLVGNHLEAEKRYRNALMLDSGYSYALDNQAVNYRELAKKMGEQGKLEEAIFYLSKAAQVLKEDYEVYRLLGTAYGFKENHAEAIKYFEIAAELGPEHVISWENLGKAYTNLGDEEKANIYFKKARELGAASSGN